MEVVRNMAEPKRTALAMMEGCEDGVGILREASLSSPTDNAQFRADVQSGELIVGSCVTCQGNPGAMEDGDMFACPLRDPSGDGPRILRSVLRVEL